MSRLALVTRRVVVTPAACVLILVVLAISPAIVIATLIAGVAVDRRFRLTRGVLLAITYLVHDLATVFVALAYWLRNPRRARDDPDRRAIALARALLARMYASAQAFLRIDVELDGEASAVEDVASLRTPVIVLCRHAGPGDTFLIAHELMTRGRTPRSVVRAALSFDPTIGILGRRMAFCFVRRNCAHGDQGRRRVEDLARSLRHDDALLLFPEGGNVTDARRRSNLLSLLRHGRVGAARRAGRLQHVAAPHPGGTLAALRGAPHADVIFVAHSGLAGMSGPMWSWIPADMTLRMHWFRVAASELPEDDAAAERWLLDWWHRLDAWVSRDEIAQPMSLRA